MELTCDKVGGYNYVTDGIHPGGTYTAQAGYGRINAYNAVLYALRLYYTISGPSSVCSSSQYSINAKPGDVVSWSVSPAGVATLTPSGSSASLTKVSNGSVTLTATLNGNFSVARTIITQLPVTASISSSQNSSCNSGIQTWSLTASPNVDGASNWHWSVDNTSASSQINIYTPTNQSTYVDVKGGGGVSVTYTDRCGEVAPKKGITVYSSCPQSSASASDISIYPNPSSSTVTIDFIPQNTVSTSTALIAAKTDVTALLIPETVDLYSQLTSKAIFTLTKKQILESTGKAVFNVSGLPSDFYFIHVNYQNTTIEKTVQIN